MNKVKVILDREKCIAATPCITIAPKYFKMGTDAKVDLLGSKLDEKTNNYILQVEVDDDELEILKSAAAACPVQVIIIDDN